MLDGLCMIELMVMSGISSPGLLNESTQVRIETLTRRRAIWWFLESSSLAPPCLQTISLVYQLFSSALIVALFIVDSQTMSQQTTNFYHNMEVCATTVFTIEYIMRVYSCVESEIDVDLIPGWSRCKMRVWLMCSAASIIDTVSLISLYLDVCIASNVFRGVVSLRLLRLFTLFRLERRHKFFSPILIVISNKRTELGATLGIAGLLLLISSTLMYYVESAVNPKFNSILASMWWGTETLTTVGYGDIIPETPGGKALGSVVAFAGVGLFGLPAGIISSGFSEIFSKGHDQCKCQQLEADVARLVTLQKDVLAELQGLRSQVAALQHVASEEKPGKRSSHG